MNKHTILIIEDDLNLRELYQKVLIDHDYDVQTAGDGESGLKKLQQGGNDLTFLDMILPGFNGVEILKRLKAAPVSQEGKPNGPIVLMTNTADDALLKEAASLGATTHIVKTDITPSVLLRKIEGFLQ